MTIFVIFAEYGGRIFLSMDVELWGLGSVFRRDTKSSWIKMFGTWFPMSTEHLPCYKLFSKTDSRGWRIQLTLKSGLSPAGPVIRSVWVPRETPEEWYEIVGYLTGWKWCSWILSYTVFQVVALKLIFHYSLFSFSPLGRRSSKITTKTRARLGRIVSGYKKETESDDRYLTLPCLVSPVVHQKEPNIYQTLKMQEIHWSRAR